MFKNIHSIQKCVLCFQLLNITKTFTTRFYSTQLEFRKLKWLGYQIIFQTIVQFLVIDFKHISS